MDTTTPTPTPKPEHLLFDKLPKILITLTIWLCFNISFAILPMLINWVLIYVHLMEPYNHFWEFMSPKGELLIVSAAISGETIGEVVKCANIINTLKALFIGFNFFTALFSVLLYQEVTSKMQSTNPSIELLNFSLSIFVAIFLIGVVCKILVVLTE